MKYFTRSDALKAARRSQISFGMESYDSILNESVKRQEQRNSFDIFLSHAIKDADLITGVISLLEDSGFTVYVDWIIDPLLERDKVNAKTAEVLRKRMRQCKSLIYVHTYSSTESKWMPWELGYFDGFKPEKVSILPLAVKEDEQFKGQEYLELYPIINKSVISDELKYAWVDNERLPEFIRK